MPEAIEKKPPKNSYNGYIIHRDDNFPITSDHLRITTSLLSNRIISTNERKSHRSADVSEKFWNSKISKTNKKVFTNTRAETHQ